MWRCGYRLQQVIHLDPAAKQYTYSEAAQEPADKVGRVPIGLRMHREQMILELALHSSCRCNSLSCAMSVQIEDHGSDRVQVHPWHTNKKVCK